LVWQPEAVSVYRDAYRKSLAREVNLHPLEGAKIDGEIARLERIVEVESKVMERFPVDPQYAVALQSGNLELIRSLPSLAQVDERIEAGLANDALISEFRAYRREGVQLTERLKERKAERDVSRTAAEIAERDIEDNMTNNEGWRRYHEQLDEIGQVRFLAHQYADSYLANYIEMTVSHSTYVSLTSQAQPGVFQALRQTEFVTKDTFLSRKVRALLRFAESPMDTTAFRPGLNNWVKRNIPFYRDATTTYLLRLRQMWERVGVGYFVSYYIFQVKFNWPTAFYFLWAGGGLVQVMYYWLNRWMINIGVRPMEDTWSKLKYSNRYTWMTYPAYIPFFFWKSDFDAWWRAWVWNPIVYVGSAALDTCARLLRGGD
jgi:hypothetical protein